MNQSKIENSQPTLQQHNVIRWPDSVRLKMIEKSEFYGDPTIYHYGYYDGYQLQNEKIDKAIKLIQKARSNNGDDATLQDAIITLLGWGLRITQIFTPFQWRGYSVKNS